MSMKGFLGVRGTGDWVTNQRPESWREQILYLYPNGRAPLTALLAMLKEETVDDPKFHWWTEEQEAVRAALVDSGVYTTSALTTAYVSAATSGDTVFLKVSTDDAKLFRVGHTVLMRDASDLTVDVVGKVTSTGSAYAGVELLEDDDNSTLGDLSDADEVIIIGNANEEGASMPNAVAFDVTEHDNVTQIFRTPLEITRTAEQTTLRTRPMEYQKLKAEALERHSIEMEFAFLFGIKTNAITTGTKRTRTTGGVTEFVKTSAPANVSDYAVADTGFVKSYDGKTWLDAAGGNLWFQEMLERIFRYGSTERLALCGSGALLGLSWLAQTHGTINLQPGATLYVMNLQRWESEFGTVFLKTHPLMNAIASMRNTIIMIEPRNIIYRYIQDTMFFDDPKGNNAGNRRTDGRTEEYLTECGLELHHPQTFGILNGVGSDNAA